MYVEQLCDQEVLSFYQEAIQDSSDDMKPMLRLVERLCAKEYAKIFAAGTSHDTLVIGDKDADNISVAYDPHLHVFQVRYWNRKGKVEKHRCTPAEAENLIDNLALRLFLTSRQRSDGKESRN